jgi:hypothetical protein
MANPDSFKAIKIIFVFCLFVLCWMIIFSPLNQGSWLNNHSFEQHHPDEFEHEILFLIFTVFLIIGSSISRSYIRDPLAKFLIVSPQSPPPK